MPRDLSRKKPKRISTRRKINVDVGVDDDLLELTSVLAEYRLDNSVDGWFEIPWRNGWNAAQLALDCYRTFELFKQHDEISVTLDKWLHDRYVSPAIYEAASNFITSVALALLSDEHTYATGFLLVSLRCVQLVISNSSGGGAVFNDILRHRFARTPCTPILATVVRTARCHDAIGVGPAMANDRHDRLRRAFLTAWDRGLYRVAYALPTAR